MNKSIHFSDRENAEKRNREVTDPAQQTGFNQANSINRSTSAMPVSMPDLSLAYSHSRIVWLFTVCGARTCGV